MDCSSQTVNTINVDPATLDDDQLIEAIRFVEASYKQDLCDLEGDHRRFLTRKELETVFHLVRRAFELRSESRRLHGQIGIDQNGSARGASTHANVVN